jgi:serine protease Do
MKETDMKRTILLSTLLSVSLFSGEITFENAPTNPKHKLPNSQNEILSFNSILKESMNAVVNISTSTIIKNRRGPSRLFFDPYTGQYFEQRGPLLNKSQRKKAHSLGSGVIVSKDGYIVTNHHVLAGADEIAITMNNSKKEYIARVIGTDKGSDLAVIKIEAEDLEPITLSHAKDIQLGDVVFAIGNPFGVGQTVTQGIISALNKNHVGINQYENFIQTDASINPGNSGGALIDSRGALIGINSAILSESGGNNGIGFTIPVDMMRNVVKKLIKDGKVHRGFMGVGIEGLSKEVEHFYTHQNGAIITAVEPRSAAKMAKLQVGDLVYAVNGIAVKSPDELQRVIVSYSPNDTISLSIERDKSNIKKELTLMSRD